MRKLLLIVVLVCMVAPTVAGLGGCTMTMDPADHGRVIARNANLELRQIVEDIDYLLLVDEVSQLSPWYLPDPE